MLAELLQRPVVVESVGHTAEHRPASAGLVALEEDRHQPRSQHTDVDREAEQTVTDRTVDLGLQPGQQGRIQALVAAWRGQSGQRLEHRVPGAGV